MRIFVTTIALAAFAGIAPVAQAQSYPAVYREPVTRYENYNYNKVIYSSPEEYWIRTSPYAAANAFLHPYWRNTYHQRTGNVRPYVNNERFNRFLADAYYRGYLGNEHVQPYDIPRRPVADARCLNYTITQRNAHVPGREQDCLEHRRGHTPVPHYNRYR